MSAALAAHQADTKPRHKKRKISREALLKSLQILGNISAPLPPELPPSPPASRSASPAPSISSKRKPDSDPRLDADAAKRQRTLDGTSSHRPHPPSTQTTGRAHSHRTAPHGADPREDDQPHAESSSSAAASSSSSCTPASSQSPNIIPSAALPTPHMPIRRARRGRVGLDFEKQHDDFYKLGRLFKYSGDARHWASYAPTHRHYKPLSNPPPPGSPYHTHGGLMARLELIDALICFVYAEWSQEYGLNRCKPDSWNTGTEFMRWCREKWDNENSNGPREKVFLGLIYMMESFIAQRKVHYAVVGHLGRHFKEAIRPSEKAGLLKPPASNPAMARSSSTTQRSPPGMLPSPAGTSSTNSTPTNPGNGTPSKPDNLGLLPPSSSSVPPGASPRLGPPPMIQLPGPLLGELNTTLDDQRTAAYSMGMAQKHLSLPVLREHFPRTFGRMVFSTLTAQDEHEPFIDDDDGELFWPGQCVTGEGLGWVCLMGRAMVNEFGRDFGYQGKDGIVKKT